MDSLAFFFTFSSLIIYFGLFLIRKTTALLTIFNMRESLFSFKGRLGPKIERDCEKKYQENRLV